MSEVLLSKPYFTSSILKYACEQRLPTVCALEYQRHMIQLCTRSAGHYVSVIFKLHNCDVLCTRVLFHVQLSDGLDAVAVLENSRHYPLLHLVGYSSRTAICWML
jgi:hypothetical protein